MKKICLKANIEDERSKRRIIKAVAAIEGVESVIVDMTEGKMTVIGDADPVFLTVKLRKFGFRELLSVGPAKTQKCEAKKAEKVGPAKPKKFEAKKAKKKEGSHWDTENRGANHYLGVQKEESNWDTENRGANHYLGLQRAEAVGVFGCMNRAIEDNEGSKTSIVEAVARFGDFSSIQVDIKKGMVTVVGKSVPVRVAHKVREMGYRAKLLSLGPATEEEDPDEEDNEDLYPNHPSTTRNERYPYTVVTDEDYTTQGWNLTAILTVKEHFARIFLDVLGGIKNKVHKASLLQKTPSQLPDELPRS